jgi:hypothetical protein
MNVSDDKQADVLCFRLSDEPIIEGDEVAPGSPTLRRIDEAR